MTVPEHKALRPMKMSELPEEGQVALRAMRRASRKLGAEHKRLGLPLVVWENGKMV